MQVHAARYKDEVSEEDRKRQSQQAMEQYPDKVPVICEMHNRSKLKPIPKRK